MLRRTPEACSCTCTALRQAARRITQAYDADLAPIGIGVNQYSILARLGRHGPLSIRDLADTLAMDRSTLGHLLRPLEARGLVALTVPADDRRRRLLALTAGGETLLAAARPLWEQAQHRFDAAYGGEAAQALRNVLNRVATVDLSAAPRAAPLTRGDARDA